MALKIGNVFPGWPFAGQQRDLLRDRPSKVTGTVVSTIDASAGADPAIPVGAGETGIQGQLADLATEFLPEISTYRIEMSASEWIFHNHMI